MTESPRTIRGIGRRLFGILLPLALIGLGFLGAAYFMQHRPQPGKKTPVPLSPLVTVQQVTFGRKQVVIRAMGTVVPAQKVALTPQVAGRVVHVATGFEPGGILAQGMRIVQLDPKDYELRVALKKTALVQARAALVLEQGHQEVARQEWDLLRGDQHPVSQEAPLALRKPQEEQARAAVDRADLELEQAVLDLERTSVTVPYTCLVLEKHVALGAQVTSQTPIATLVGTDAFWVETLLARDRLAWIKIPKGGKGPGSMARIISDKGQYERTGTVIRLLGDIQSQGRMARVLVRVEDPLLLQKTNTSELPLLLGEYVHVALHGRVLEHVAAIPRDALRDGDTIWIADQDNTLAIRSVHSVWRDAHTVYLEEGIQEGERVIVSDIPAPIQGMAVRLAHDAGGSVQDASTLSEGQL